MLTVTGLRGTVKGVKTRVSMSDADALSSGQGVSALFIDAIVSSSLISAAQDFQCCHCQLQGLIDALLQRAVASILVKQCWNEIQTWA